MPADLAPTPNGKPAVWIAARFDRDFKIAIHKWRVAGESQIDGVLLRETKRPQRYVIAHRTPDGRWQATWFDDDGAGGDLRRDTLEEALNEQAHAGSYKLEELHLIADRTKRTNPVVRGDTSASLARARSFCRSIRRPGHAYRGMTTEEFDATVGLGLGVRSSNRWSAGTEGTSFADDPEVAESYANFGSTDPRRTGQPTFMVEVSDRDLVRKPDGYLMTRRGAGVAQDQVTRAWRMAPQCMVFAQEIPVTRSNPRSNPSAPTGAIQMFRRFHTRDYRGDGEFAASVVIPERVICAGDAVNVLYASDKLHPETGEDEGWVDYIHEHSAGVRVYRCDRGAQGDDVAVPAWLRRVEQLTWLGDCLGFEYRNGNGGVERAHSTKPLPQLYCTTNGKALLVIQSKRTLLAMMWGGKLGVQRRGIVH